MECESYNLNWAEFDAYTSFTFKQLLKNQDFTDVTLACDGEESIEAHKVVLSACSPFFNNLLKKKSHSHPLIYLSDVTHGDLKALVNFMYLGQTNVAQENLQRFLKVATKFKVKGLTDGNKDQPSTVCGESDVPSNGMVEENQDFETDVNDILDVEDNAAVLEPALTVKTENEDNSSYYLENVDENESPETSYLIENVIPRSNNTVPMSVTIDNEKVYPCDQCEYKATYACNLTAHKRTVHEKLFFHCDYCPYKSSRKDRLNKHIVAKHNSEFQ